MKNATIKDIARIAGVSAMTVSRALRNDPAVREETREKVQRIAAECHYVANLSAKSLVLRRSYNVGLFFTSLLAGTSPDFFRQVVGTVNRYIPQEYNLVLKGINESDENLVDSRRFDGVLILSQSPEDDGFIERVSQKQLPMVVLNREIKGLPLLNIFSSDEQGAGLAAQYLIGKGHRKFAIIKGIRGFESTLQRAAGFLKAVRGGGMEEPRCAEGEYSVRSGYVAMQKLLLPPKAPTAVFCSNDDMAVGAMKAIAERRLRVPEDISIVGYDDSLVCDYVTPTLTSVRKPTEEVAALGTERLMAMIRGGEHGRDEKISFEPKLVVRGSAGECRH